MDNALKMTGIAQETINQIQIKHEKLNSTNTSPGNVKKLAGMYEYVTEGYMRKILNKHYPIWSWSRGSGPQIVNGWVVSDGTLRILDEGVWREYYSVGAARIQVGKGETLEVQNIKDLSNNVKAANTHAFKVAVNRLCNIADDVYRKMLDDTDLTEAQVVEYRDLAKQKGKSEEAEDALENNQVDQSNFARAIMKLESMEDANG
ncbi:hypothetical protein ACFL4H_00265 [Candidatus Neomarinimicrobiota bacterium]